MRHRHPLTILAALLLAALLLTACALDNQPAGTAPEAAAQEAPRATVPDRADSQSVHAAWVQALDRADVDAAVELVAIGSPDERRWFVEGKIEELQRYKTGGQRWPGAFRALEILGVRTEGADQVGYSRWSFEHGTLCYYEELRQIDGVWAVEGWYQAGRADRCEG